MYQVNNHYEIGHTNFGWDNESKRIGEKTQNIRGVIIYNLKKGTKPTNDSIKNEGVIVCDSGASFSVFKDLSLFTHGVWEAETETYISGVQRSNYPIKITKEGLTPFGVVGYSEETDVNILSLAQIAEYCTYWHGEGDSIFVKQDDKIYHFKKNAEKVYVWKKEDGVTAINKKTIKNNNNDNNNKITLSISTVKNNKKNYTFTQIKNADRARKLQAQMGYINENKMIKMIRLNQINNCDVTEVDIRNSVDIYGRSIDYLKGNSNGKKGAPVKFEPFTLLPGVQKSQMLSMDIMVVGKQLSLITVATPLEMTFTKKLHGKTEIELGDAIISQIEEINGKGFKVEKVIWDSEPSVKGDYLSGKIRGKVYELEIFEPGRHVARVERKIQRVKKMFRAIKMGSVYSWDSIMDNLCIQYCVHRLNHMTIDNSTDESSPYTKMTGRRADAKYDYRHEFGEYVQYLENDTSNSTIESRTYGALALFPAGSDMWYYRRLIDGKVIKRSRAVEIPISEDIIAFINERTISNKGPLIPCFALGKAIDVTDLEDDDCEKEEGQLLQIQNNKMQPDRQNELYHDKDIVENMSTYGAGLQGEEEEVLIEADGITQILNEEENVIREYTTPESIRYNCVNMTVKEAVMAQGDAALKEIIKEIKNIHIERKGFEPLLLKELTEEQKGKIISSKIFIKNKYLADGSFDKVKARLVAGGHLQDRSVYSNGGSPTASTSSLFTVAAIAAREERAVGTIDFPSAFLNCDMPKESEEVLMRLDQFSTMILTEIDKSFIQYVNVDGTSIIRLKIALYGCVESARIWNDKLDATFVEMGFKRNEYDKCVYNRIEDDGSQSTLLVHVDDVLVSAKDEKRVDNIMDEIEELFGEVTKNRGRVLNYVGLTFDFRILKTVKITMQGFIADLMAFVEKRSDFCGTAVDPASGDLFDIGVIDDKNKLLENKEKEFFHSLTAKLLYLSKRVRPDILVAVAFLCKRVQVPTEEDMKKLIRVLQYIRGTFDFGIKLEVGNSFSIIAFVDASYGVHTNMRSHTGYTVGLGSGPICSKSSSQKINCKSSTEAELIGMSDSLGHIIWLRNFILSQGYKEIGPATIMQDNKSTIQLARNGQPNSDATRHISIRYFFVHDRMKNNEIKLEWISTDDMISDILTKPIQGKKFKELRSLLLNWN